MLDGYEPKREIQGVEAEPAPDVVMDLRLQELFREKAEAEAVALLNSLQGGIRHGEPDEDSRQLRAQLSRWLKRRRARASAR